jgi:hypothetical protein
LEIGEKMQTRTKVHPLEKRQVTTTLPIDMLREIEETYEKIHNDTDYGTISLEIVNGNLYKSSYSVTKVHMR